MDWIDEEYKHRKNGMTRGLTQNQHEAVNARYPDCTLEYCRDCGEPTGNAGRGDDSLYTDDGAGPFCAACFEMANDSLSGPQRPALELDDGTK